MIILKIIAFVALSYFFAKGIKRDEARKVEKLNKKLKDYDSYAKEKFQKLEAEKAILTRTIKELKGELC